MQHLVCETLADLYLRFECEYNTFPYKLVLTTLPTTSKADKERIARDFHCLPKRRPYSTEHYPGV